MKKPGMLTTRCAGCCGSRGSCSGLSLPLALARGGEVLLGLGGQAVGSERPARRVGSVAAPLRRSSRWAGRRGGVTVGEVVASAASQRKPMESAGICGSDMERDMGRLEVGGSVEAVEGRGSSKPLAAGVCSWMNCVALLTLRATARVGARARVGATARARARVELRVRVRVRLGSGFGLGFEGG